MFAPPRASRVVPKAKAESKFASRRGRSPSPARSEVAQNSTEKTASAKDGPSGGALVFPRTRGPAENRLNSLGWIYRRNGRLRSVETGDLYDWEAFTGHFDDLSVAIEDYVIEAMQCHPWCLQQLPLNIFDAPSGTSQHILASENVLSHTGSLLLLVPGIGMRAGVWSRSLCATHGLGYGAMFPFLALASGAGMLQVLLDPAACDDRYDGQLHTHHCVIAWLNIVEKCRASEIFIVAHSYGGASLIDILAVASESTLSRIHGIAFTDSVHFVGRDCLQLRAGTLPPRAREVLRSYAVMWLADGQPVDTEIAAFNEDRGCRCVSAGVERHADTNAFSCCSIFLHFASKAAQPLPLFSEGLDHIARHVRAVADLFPNNPQEASARAVFQEWDKDKNGVISLQDLIDVIQELHPGIRPESLGLLFKEMDLNHDGEVDYEEFLAWVFKQDPDESLNEHLPTLKRCPEQGSKGALRHGVRIDCALELPGNTQLYVCSGSIVRFDGDAIVNPANRGCLSGGGIDGAIAMAGGKELLEARRRLPILPDSPSVRCPTGEARITIGGKLPAQWCIHAVGPHSASHDTSKDDKLLIAAYRSAMECAAYKKLKNIAFSLLSSGIARGSQSLERVIDCAFEGIEAGLYDELEEVYIIGSTPEELKLLSRLAHRRLAPVEDLVNKGFCVRQLLEFYRHYRHARLIKQGTTTNDVVREIVIKETCDSPRCYMESEFMMRNGGPQRAKRLVSHAWKSDFLNTVISIVLDATEWSLSFLLKASEVNGYKAFVRDGTLDVDLLLSRLSKEALNRTYWLCIFAIDEHHAICGDCWTCNAELAWTRNKKAHLVASTCLICRQPKFNPCTCGTLKWKPTDPQYQIDKFDKVVTHMEALVVALDGDFNSIRRIWVVAEVAEASQFIPVFFRRSSALAGWTSEKLAHDENLLDTVEKCEATSTLDRDRILEQVRRRDGGIKAYDMFVNYLLNVQFGKYEQLETLFGFAREAANRVTSVSSEFSWQRDRLHAIPKNIDMLPKFHPGLRHLSLDFSSCKGIIHIGALDCLEKFGSLTNLALNFTCCEQIADISVLVCLGKISSLTNLALIFRDCSQITDISFLACLEKLSSLTIFTLDCTCCKHIADFSVLACLGKLGSLTNLTLLLRECVQITDITFLACLEKLSSLTNLTLYFRECVQISDISVLACLEKLSSLNKLRLLFRDCEQISDISVLACLEKLSSLTNLTLNFTRCEQIPDIHFLACLEKLSSLTNLALLFRECEQISDISVLACLEKLSSLTNLTLIFWCCSLITDISFLACLEKIGSLTNLTLIFWLCSQITDVSVLTNLQKLSSLTTKNIQKP